MPERRNRIDYDCRLFIEKGLNDKASLAFIAKTLSLHVSTVQREIARNRVQKEGRINVKSRRNICKYRPICTNRGICDPHCQGLCRSCSKVNCNEKCDLFDPKQCVKLQDKPHVCNGCDLLGLKGACDCQRFFYDARAAQDMAEERMREPRRKPYLSSKEMKAMSAFLSPRLKKGQSPAHIWRTHPEAFEITLRTFYNYLAKGYFEELKMLLPAYVRRRVYGRKPSAKTNPDPSPVFDGRRYCDFEDLEEERRMHAVEMDCVESARGSEKVILALLFRESRFQVMLLLEEHTKAEVKKALDAVEHAIGLEAFRRHLGTILTDHGHEFVDFELLESSCTEDGARRCRVFYCDPSRPDQKGACEKLCAYAHVR